jgi:glycosyltransferase involved in cell wall biosynthesis
MPYGVLEAMASGLPVVATDVNGSRDLVQDGVTGRIVPPGDVTRLTEAMADVLEKPEKAAGMARAGQARVSEHYTLNQMLDKIEELYRQVVRSPEQR